MRCHRTLILAGSLIAGLASALSAQPSQPSGVPKERWDVLPVAGSGLHASKPVLGQTDHQPDFSRELYEVQWREKDPMDLYIVRPTGIAKPPVVLVLYSYPTEAAKFLNNALCENFVKHGFAVAGFVSALTGQRYHDRPMKEWFVSQLPESIGASVHDVQMVIDYLGTRDDLDMSRIGIFGQGSGGTIAILSAIADPRIKAVDVMDPWGDWPAWLASSPQVPTRERPDYLRTEFLASAAPLDPTRWLPEWKQRTSHTPLRIQENLFNQAMPEAVRKRMESASAGSAEIVEYRDQQEYAAKVSSQGRMLDWMQQNLRSDDHAEGEGPLGLPQFYGRR